MTCNELAPVSNLRCTKPAGHVIKDHEHRRGDQLILTWYADGPFEWAPGLDPADELRLWWLGRAEDEIDRTVPKAIEYGSGDLIEIGRDLATLMGREVTDQEATELGIYFYIRGKMARWADAIRRGVPASDDTLFDLGVYVRMAQRSRSHGGWPGVKETAE